MGYLIVLTATFTVNLVVASMVLGWISHALFGVVQDWVLLVAAGQSMVASWLAANWYDNREQRSRRCS
jgi:hypothetical protein